MARGVSFPGGFDILQTLRSPLAVWAASISDFCFDEDACHASEIMGDGPREVVNVCKMVKLGRRVAIKTEPFWYLHQLVRDWPDPTSEGENVPDGICSAISSRRQRRDGVEDSANRYMFRRRRLEKNHFALRIACHEGQHLSECPQANDLPNATFPFRIQAATRKSSNEENLAIVDPVNRSHTMAICAVS
jgi:hypothetical protein